MSQQNDRYAPFGFYHLAEDFYRSGKLTAEANEQRLVRLHYGHVPYHLHTHSIELALKAFLRTRKVGVDALSKLFRHDLANILTNCEELRLKFRKPKRTREVVGMLNELARTQTFRYFESGSHTLPALYEVRDANERILVAVRSECAKSVKMR